MKLICVLVNHRWCLHQKKYELMVVWAHYLKIPLAKLFSLLTILVLNILKFHGVNVGAESADIAEVMINLSMDSTSLFSFFCFGFLVQYC